MSRGMLNYRRLAYEMGVYLATRLPEPHCTCDHLESEHFDGKNIESCQMPECICKNFTFQPERKANHGSTNR